MDNLTLEYIGGFFDGDGCVTISKDKIYNHRLKNGWQLSPYIVFSQRKKYILERVRNTLKSYNIGSHLQSQSNGRIYALRITGMKRCRKFCKIFINHTTIKREQLKVMLEFTNYRLSQSGRKEYTKQDLEYYEKLKKLKI